MACSMSCGAQLDYHWWIEKFVCKIQCISQSFKVYEQMTCFRVCKMFQTHFNSSLGLVLKFQLGFLFLHFAYLHFALQPQ